MHIEHTSQAQHELNNKLLKACQRSSIKQIKDLLAQGADPMVRTKSMIHLPFWAARLGKTSVLEALLDGGLPINVKVDMDGTGSQLIHTAARNGRSDMCRMLVEKGADIEALQGGWYPPLYLTAMGKNKYTTEESLVKTAETLLDLGANIDAKNRMSASKHGTSTLVIAICHGFTSLFQLLINRGANTNGVKEALAMNVSFPAARKEMAAMLASVKAKQAIDAVMDIAQKARP
jgi:ankyrin repeat protein